MTSRFKSIVVHIGLGKTGTSAIQRVLLQRAGELESSCAILFPLVEDDPRRFAGNHTLVLRSICSANPQTLRFNIAAGLDTEAAARAADEQVRARFAEQFAVTQASTLLLSAEGVGHFDEEAVERLATWLRPLGEKIRLLAWIRHPQHSLAAEIQQRLKTGSVLERLYERPPCYRYSALLSRLERSFGKESIELYDYAESIAPGSSAIATFFDKVGVNLPVGEQENARVNVGLSLQATLLLDAANRLRPLIVDGARNPLRKPNDMMRILKVPGEPYAPPPAVYERLSQLAQPELDWLSQHYGFEPEALPPRNAPRDHDVIDQAALDAQAISLLDDV